MIIRREGRPIPVFTADRATVLNPTISPHARLLYVTLLAVLDQDEADLDAVASLVQHEAGLAPLLEELSTAGAVTLTHGDHLGVTVHQQPIPGEGRGHACKTCQDCGACACAAYRYSGPYCDRCGAIRDQRDWAQRDIARWQAQLDAGAVYTLGSNSRLLHRWDCKSLNSPEKGLALLAEVETNLPEHIGGDYWPRLPQLYTAEEMRAMPRRYRGCQLCKPDPV